jgi:hypothetical protein
MRKVIAEYRLLIFLFLIFLIKEGSDDQHQSLIDTRIESTLHYVSLEQAPIQAEDPSSGALAKGYQDR